ncbi:MAG: hypothetical protein Kow0098_29550 [Ignavibacteriaceae bacterium]
MRCLIFITELIIFLSCVAVAQQDQVIRNYHPLSGRFYISAEGGVTYSKTDFKDALPELLTRLDFGYYIPGSDLGVFGFRAFASYGFIGGEGGATSNRPALTDFKTTILNFGGGLNYTLHASDHFYPYLFAGASYLFFDPKDQDGNLMPRNSAGAYSNNEYTLIGEAGFKVPFSEVVSFNMSFGIDFTPNDNLDDLPNFITGGTDDDIFFHGLAGISIFLGGKVDKDGDGVPDDRDFCPKTPQGVTVDEFGCPVDIDKDGVPDYIDVCPGTPANITVDSHGCPVDSDGDGVPDYLDICKDTPLNVKVDSRGCPIDTDNDGVPDYKDKCPGTPAGTEVDRKGCEVIPEIQEPPKPKTKVVLSGGANFEVGKATLLPHAQYELEKLVTVMNEYPETRWRVEGHTDNTGSYQANISLSLRRANSVVNYFVKRGISRSRFEVVGLGPDYPIADNSTETGRALNRRVTIELIGEENEIQQVPQGHIYNNAVERNVGDMIFTDGYLYCYQVSSWRTRGKAEYEMRELQAQGYNAFIVEANLPELDGTWYRVRVGYFDSLEEARQSKNSLGY